MEMTTLWNSVNNMKKCFKKVSKFHNSNVSHCWSLFFCLLSVNTANVFCMKLLFTHSRLLTSRALSTNQHISYTHIICAGWLQGDGCTFFSAINCRRLAAKREYLRQQFSPKPQFLHVLFMNSLMLYLLLPCAPFRSPFFSCYPACTPLSFCLARLSLGLSYFHVYLPAALIFPSDSPGALISPGVSPHLSISLPSQALPALLFSSYTIISSSCTCSIAHCSTVELELCKEKTDYLLSCKITTRLFPFCWPGLCLGDKQHCLLFFSLPRIPSTLSWLLATEWIINHFLPYLRVSSLEILYTLFFSVRGFNMLCFPWDSSGKGLNLPQILFMKPKCALQFVLWKVPILFRTLTLTQIGKGCLDRQPCADSMLNTMRMGTQVLHVKCGWDVSLCACKCVHTLPRNLDRELIHRWVLCEPLNGDSGSVVCHFAWSNEEHIEGKLCVCVCVLKSKLVDNPGNIWPCILYSSFRTEKDCIVLRQLH